jgi:hypothetical protein
LATGKRQEPNRKTVLTSLNPVRISPTGDFAEMLHGLNRRFLATNPWPGSSVRQLPYVSTSAIPTTEEDGIEAYLAANGAEQYQSETLARTLARLRRHIYLQEELLFPLLKKSGLMGPVFAVEREHGQLWNTVADIDSSIERGDAPGTRTARTLLLAFLDEHMLWKRKSFMPRPTGCSMLGGPAH